MSRDWTRDIEDMHTKFGVNDWVEQKVKEKDWEMLRDFLDFRMRFLDEELTETKKAVAELDAEEIVDGLIDLCVVAIGTLDAFGINAAQAWSEVHDANMSKTRGVKPSRPNPFGMPDLIKPEGWLAPSHEHNHGALPLLQLIEQSEGNTQ